MKKILITGANGFVGRSSCGLLEKTGYSVRAVVRDHNEAGVDAIKKVLSDIICVGNIDGETNWSDALLGIDVVIHLAARVHILQEMSKDPLEAFRKVNVHGSRHLAKMAMQSGVRRFVYVSSVSIHGNSTTDSPYAEGDIADPYGPYAVSKWEAELVLKKVAEESGMELVVIRPPLVYGPGVGGNFLRLMHWAKKGWPLPLGSVRNKRSFIGIDNLADIIVRCVDSPNVVGETLLVSDGEDISTPDLIKCIAYHLKKPAVMFPFPVSVLRAAAKVVGMNDVMYRLCNSLQVNSEKARRLLGWSPKVGFDEGIAKTVAWYAEQVKE